jgi:hypothetical protein
MGDAYERWHAQSMQERMMAQAEIERLSTQVAAVQKEKADLLAALTVAVGIAREAGDDVTADDIEGMARRAEALEAALATAREEGARAMREAAAKACEAEAYKCVAVISRMAGTEFGEDLFYAQSVLLDQAGRIRLLPLPLPAEGTGKPAPSSKEPADG